MTTKPKLTLDDYMDFARQRGTTSVDSIQVRKLSVGASLPIYGSNGAAGLDLSADLSLYDSDEVKMDGLDHTLTIEPGQRRIVKTGISVALPRGTYGRIAPRSGLAVKKGIGVMAGVIDEDYRGEVGVVLINHGSEPFVVKQRDRIAQMIVERYVPVIVYEVDDHDSTERGAKGFGSTG